AADRGQYRQAAGACSAKTEPARPSVGRIEHEDAQDHCVVLRAGRARGDAQGQARHAAGPAAAPTRPHHHPPAPARPGPGPASRRPWSDRETVSTLRLILHPTGVIKPAVDGCPLVAANSMEIEKVRSFLLQIREKDDAAPLGGIVRAILSPLVVFPK